MPGAIPLSKAEEGSVFRMLSVKTDVRTSNKLWASGLVPSSTIEVVSNSRAGLIIKVEGSRMGINTDLAHVIIVEPLLGYETSLFQQQGQ